MTTSGHFCIKSQLVYDYFGFHPKKNNLCHISCKCDQFSCNPMNIQRCILCILKSIIGYNKIYKCMVWMYTNGHIICVFKDYY
jgi:hypothetical protein